MSGMADTGASAGFLPADVPVLHARAAAGKPWTLDDAAAAGRPLTLDDAVMHSPPGGKLQRTPLSQPSTAPSTPSLSFSLEGEGHGMVFYRCVSGASTIEPVIEREHDEDDWEESALPPLPFSMLDREEDLDEQLFEVRDLYKSRFGKDVDDESDEECEYDQDGTAWIKHVGEGPLTMSVLEEKLARVKELYEANYGSSVDSEEYEQDEDGMAWIKTVGTGPVTVNTLESALAEIKELYRGAFGRDADADSDDEDLERDADGTRWTKTTGSGALTAAVLEGRLEEVKELYEAKYGCDVDAESEEGEGCELDEDGTAWVKTVGTGPLTVGVLEDKLAEVKALYKGAFGQDADAESDAEDLERDADGTLWTKTTGKGALTVAVLEERLEEVKELYEAKYGCDVDAASEGEGCEYDEDGTAWLKTVGTGPLTMGVLEGKLAEVKDLYKGAFGQDVDADSDAEGFERDADGTLWTKTTGSGPLTVAVLEERLEEVKELYEAKYGCDVDAESEGEGCEYDEDGTAWLKTVGTGPLTVGVLEGKLAEVKALYKGAFGKDADAESDDEDLERDADGTLWTKTTGKGALTVAVLEGRLEEVKELYEAKYGCDVDAESECESCEYDEDGTAWLKTVGTGPLTVGVLEDKLAEVKKLYTEAFGQDVDAESECEDFEHDADGTLWIKTTGKGPLTVAVLEECLEEAKELYEAKFGADFDDSDEEDADEAEDGQERERDADGTLWIKTVGAGPLTLDALDRRLAEVKELYKERYGKEIEGPSDDECECECDEEGTPWIKTVGTGPLTLDTLEGALADVKSLYTSAFGRDVDAESEGDDCEYDTDGTAWVKIVGQGPLTVSVLEDKLAEVKDLYARTFGRDVDAEPEGDEYEYDADGTAWVKTVGQGPLTVSVLEDKLAEVKDLYAQAFGHDADAEPEGGEYEYDADGTAWVKTVGQGPLTVSVLEDKLAEVKALYGKKFGEDPDDEGRFEHDADGTLWVKTVGAGPLTVTVLEESLEEVKELYESRFGRFVEEESEGAEPDLQYDQEGALWFKWEGAGVSSCIA